MNSKVRPAFTLGVRAKKNKGPTLCIFGLWFGPKLLINARTLMSGHIDKCWNMGPKGCKLAPQIQCHAFLQPWAHSIH